MIVSRLAAFPLLASLLLCASCASVRIDQVDFGWPVESVLTVGSDNRVDDRRYAVAFDATPLSVAEYEDSTSLSGKQLRMLRSVQGYYYVTGPGFRHVYVFAPGESSLNLHSKITIYEPREDEQTPVLQNPAMNQRPPYIELLDGTTLKLLLTSDGIVKPEEKGNDNQ